jgi:hypothetical protein
VKQEKKKTLGSVAGGKFTKRQGWVHKRQTLLTSRFHLGQALTPVQPPSLKYLNLNHHTPVFEKTLNSHLFTYYLTNIFLSLPFHSVPLELKWKVEALRPM